MIRRILWVSNAPWVGSGYGQQTATFTKMLKDAGFDVHILANYGLSGSVSEWSGIPVYPSFWNVWGNDAIESYCEMLRPDLVITLCDVWVLDENFGFKKGVTWVPWIPLDAEPLSEANKKPLRSAAHILPFTDFGERVLREAGFTNTTQVPHGIDTDVFKPLAGASKAPDGRLMSKEDFKRTDGFVMGMVGTNMGDRKNIHVVMEAFARFVKGVPDARLRLHTDYTCPHGLNLILLMNKLGIADKVEVTPTHEYHLGYTPSQMAAFYNGMDLLLSPSKGEGFGLSVPEAAACGVPSIVTDCSAMPDVWCGGAMVQPATFQYADPNSFSKWAVVDPADLLEQIQVMYEAWQKPTKWKRLCKEVRKNALRFDARAVFRDYWVPALQKIEEIIEEGGDIERWLN